MYLSFFQFSTNDFVVKLYKASIQHYFTYKSATKLVLLAASTDSKLLNDHIADIIHTHQARVLYAMEIELIARICS